MPCEQLNHCSHPATADCSRCAIGLCSAHTIECLDCHKVFCRECKREYGCGVRPEAVSPTERIESQSPLAEMGKRCSGTSPELLMTFRRRPILRTREYPEVSQHYEIILDGAVRKYSDGREVCQDNASGWRLYKERVREMVQRQNFRCSLCNRRISEATATFEHQRRRGMGAAWRDDRCELPDGTWVNSAAHWVCNGERG